MRPDVIATHVFNMSGEFWADLNDSYGPIDREIRRLLGRLSGSDSFSFILAKLPDGRTLDEISEDDGLQEYIQCAGSADRMTVEIRRLTDGSAEQLVVGRPGESSEPVELRCNDFVSVVRENEIFDVDEAAGLFFQYYDSGRVPSAYGLRPIQL